MFYVRLGEHTRKTPNKPHLKNIKYSNKRVAFELMKKYGKDEGIMTRSTIRLDELVGKVLRGRSYGPTVSCVDISKK